MVMDVVACIGGLGEFGLAFVQPCSVSARGSSGVLTGAAAGIS